MPRTSAGKRHEIIGYEVIETGAVSRVRSLCICETELPACFDRLRAEEEGRRHVELSSRKGVVAKEKRHWDRWWKAPDPELL